MKKKTIMTLIACLLCGGMALGQEASSYAPTVPDRIPPSPTSRVFQKFTDYPISHATGTIDIQIPLYTLEAGELSIPFALKYHSSGVRVQDPVGVVGRNWAFFPGFKISRTIMSKPDEIYPVTDIGYNPTVEEELYIASPYNDDWESLDCVIEKPGHGLLPRIDGQYDIFQVNMAGLSCSFILQCVNGVDVVKQITESPLKITPLLDDNDNYFQNRLYGFEILDDKGIRYVFGEASPVHDDSQTLGYLERHTNGCFCGWMLREVVLADGSRMNFTYQQVTEFVPLYNNCVIVMDNGELKDACGVDEMTNPETGSTSRFWRYLDDAGYQIKRGNEPPYMYADKSLVPLSVTFPNGTVHFSYNANRLTGMTVKRTDNTAVKTASLSYLTPATGALLKTVTVSGEGSYRMAYKNEGEITNRGFDWWGFYNGQPTHNTNLPDLSLPVHATWGAFGMIVSSDSNVNIGDNADRSPNSLYMDTHSLISMVSPTGGTLNVTYEPHNYTVLGAVKIGGGIRVKSASLYDPVSGKTMMRNYTYGDAHYLGYRYPDAKMLVTNRYMCPLDAGYCTFRVRTYSVFPHNPYMRGSLNCVWYGMVTETAELWKKEYRFRMNPDEYTNYYTDSYASSVNEPECLLSQMNSLLYTSPYMFQEDSYKKVDDNYVKVQSISYGYDNYTYNIKGTIGMPYLKVVDGYSNCQFLRPLLVCDDNYIAPYGSPIKRYTYYIRAGVVRPGTTRKVDYHGTDSIVETVTMAYDDTRKYNAVSKTVAKSDGTQEVERYYYSNHTVPNKSSLTSAQQTAIGTLTTNNRLTTVVQQETLKDTLSLYSVLNGFDSSSRLQTEYYRKGSGAMGSRMEYKAYDSYRNPVHVVKDGTEHVVYIWGYKGQRLVAAIKGATYDAVKNALGGSTPESLSSATSPNMTLIDGLRSKLSGATVTTFTHDPLVGPLTKRDANGNLTTYEYDSDGRLYRVKDHNGKVKDRYLYHYRP